jgi:hypothetical protein
MSLCGFKLWNTEYSFIIDDAYRYIVVCQLHIIREVFRSIIYLCLLRMCILMATASHR